MATQRENIILIRNFVVKCFSYKRYQTFKILTMSIKNNHLKLDTALKLSHSGNNKLFSARLQHYLKILSTTHIFLAQSEGSPAGVNDFSDKNQPIEVLHVQHVTEINQ